MFLYRLISNLHRHGGRVTGIACMVAAGALAVHAQTPPYAEFQYSTMTGSGNTITVARLPLVLASGTVYEDVVIQFDVDAKGNLTIAPGYPTVVPSPATFIGGFLAGNYTGPSADANYMITVFGPGVTVAGATEWSSAVSAGASGETTPTSADWFAFSGPMTKHPLYQRLKAAGITATTYGFYMWGTTGDEAYFSNNWGTNTLIGVSQQGKGLTFTSFTSGGTDHNQPVDMIPYGLNP